MNALTAYHPTGMMDPTTFDQMQRVGNMLAMSPLFPEHLRKGGEKAALANGVLCMNMAMRLNEDVLTVAQNIYFVGGRPGWSATYMISKANQSGKFKNPIDWEIEGAGDTLSVTAIAELTGTGKRIAVTCDMKMAKAEGWTKNPKYQSIPQIMLRYRSATALIRLYCPEVMVGIPPGVELEDEVGMRDVTPKGDLFGDPAPAKVAAPKKAEKPAAAPVEQKPAAPTAPAAKVESEAEQKPAGPASPAPAAVDEAEVITEDGEVITKATESPDAAASGPAETSGGGTAMSQRAGMIILDLRESPTVDPVLEFHGDTLARMKVASPLNYARVEAAIRMARVIENIREALSKARSVDDVAEVADDFGIALDDMEANDPDTYKIVFDEIAGRREALA